MWHVSALVQMFICLLCSKCIDRMIAGKQPPAQLQGCAARSYTRRCSSGSSMLSTGCRSSICRTSLQGGTSTASKGAPLLPGGSWRRCDHANRCSQCIKFRHKSSVDGNGRACRMSNTCPTMANAEIDNCFTKQSYPAQTRARRLHQDRLSEAVTAPQAGFLLRPWQNDTRCNATAASNAGQASAPGAGGRGDGAACGRVISCLARLGRLQSGVDSQEAAAAGGARPLCEPAPPCGLQCLAGRFLASLRAFCYRKLCWCASSLTYWPTVHTLFRCPHYWVQNCLC